MKPITIADLAKNSFGDAEELVQVVKNNFGVGASLAVRHRTSIEITCIYKNRGISRTPTRANWNNCLGIYQGLIKMPKTYNYNRQEVPLDKLPEELRSHVTEALIFLQKA
jgi:hypothetical protein